MRSQGISSASSPFSWHPLLGGKLLGDLYAQLGAPVLSYGTLARRDSWALQSVVKVADNGHLRPFDWSQARPLPSQNRMK